MSSAIYDMPPDYEFGLEFDYSVWHPDSEITLCNVRWNNSYRDAVRFANRNALNAYIDGLEDKTVITAMSYLKPFEPIRIALPHAVASRFNYIRVHNPVQPVPGNDTIKDYYYFITGVEYISPNTTELTLQIDLFQTYIYDCTFGMSYVERSHMGIANQNQDNWYGREYLTVPEGLDIGAEYRVTHERHRDIMGQVVTPPSTISYEWSVVIASTRDLLADPGTVENPKLTTSPGGAIEGLPTGAKFYAFENIGGFISWMDSIKTTPWVGQGIISITIVPLLTRYDPNFTFNPVGPTPMDTYSPMPVKHKLFPDWRASAEIWNAIPTRYRHLRKFLTAPYMMMEVTTWTAAPIALKPENWADPDAYIMERTSVIQPNARIEFTPRRYNAPAGGSIENWGGLTDAQIDTIFPPGPQRERFKEVGDDYGDYLDTVARVGNLPQVPIVNDGALGYMASNRSQIQYARDAADWSQQRALTGNQTAYDQTNSAMRAQSFGADNQSTGVRNSQRNADQMAVVEGLTGVGTALSGSMRDPLGAIAGVYASAMGIGNAQAANAMNSREALRSIREGTSVSLTNAAFQRDTNKSLADWAAKGDYENAIAGINAKVRDAQMIPPTMSGQFAGEVINLVYNSFDLSVRWKMIDPGAMTIVGEHWLRYGYAVHRFTRNIPADLHCMTKFTYWKLSETYLTSAPIPEIFKDGIRGIFEKGVTIWRNPADMGVIDIADNMPLEGIVI